MKKYEKATKLIEESIKLTESLYFDVDNGGLRKSFRSKTYKRYDLYVKLLMNLHRKFPNENYGVKAFQAFEKSRARSMIETLSLVSDKTYLDAKPDLIKEKEKITSQLNIKNNQLSELTDSKEKEKINEEKNILLEKLEQIKTSLKKICLN